MVTGADLSTGAETEHPWQSKKGKGVCKHENLPAAALKTLNRPN